MVQLIGLDPTAPIITNDVLYLMSYGGILLFRDPTMAQPHDSGRLGVESFPISFC